MTRGTTVSLEFPLEYEHVGCSWTASACGAPPAERVKVLL